MTQAVPSPRQVELRDSSGQVEWRDHVFLIPVAPAKQLDFEYSLRIEVSGRIPRYTTKLGYVHMISCANHVMWCFFLEQKFSGDECAVTPDRTQVRDRDWLEVCRGQQCGNGGGALTGATGEAYQQIATENTKSEVFDRWVLNWIFQEQLRTSKFPLLKGLIFWLWRTENDRNCKTNLSNASQTNDLSAGEQSCRVR